MKHFLGAAALMLAAAASPAFADEIDPLHGYICTGAGTGCSNAADNGNFTPLPAGQFTNWGFEISPGPATGDLRLVFLVPTNQVNTASFNLPALNDNGTGVSITNFSRTNFFNAADGGNQQNGLAGFLGLPNAGSYSPTNDFANASAGETNAIDPFFSGNFLVFSALLPNITLAANGSSVIGNDFGFGANLPAGTVIVGLFAETSGPNAGGFVGTAASADLVITPSSVAVPGPVVASGLPGVIAGGLFLLGLARNRKRRNQPAV